MDDTARLYGGSIAVVSGLYSLFLGTTGTTMAVTDWVMVLLAIVVLVHGVALFAVPARLGEWSGPAMVAYAIVMLLNQGWMASMDGGGGMGMDGGMGDGMSGGMATAGADPGMVAVAVLMLASGVIMWSQASMEEGRSSGREM